MMDYDTDRRRWKPGEDLSMAAKSRGRKLLPAWFIDRMMDDHWAFGLLLVSGQTACIKQILDVHQIEKNGSLWIDVELMLAGAPLPPLVENPLWAVAPDRRIASINVAHIICAFEIWDS